jgi:drug/metabolite transporter (DMT)-like permease
MSWVNIWWAFFAALAFVAWPTIGKYSGASGQWVSSVVLIASTVVGVAFAYPEMRHQPFPSAKGFGLMLVASLINGYAVYMYSMKTADPMVQTGTFMCIVMVMMVVLGFAASAILTDQTVTPRQLGGVAVAVLAIWLIAG